MEVKHCKGEQGTTSRTCLKRTLVMAFDILLFLFLFLLMYSLFSFLFSVLVPADEGSMTVRQLLFMADELFLLLAAVFSSWLVLRIRGLSFSILGLRVKGYSKDLWKGALFALSFYALSFVISLLSGSVEVVSVSFSLSSLLMSFLFFGLVAVFEELALRGFVLGRMLEAGVNKFVALFLSSLLFSLLHLANPNFAVLPFINILLAGVMLGASYIYTRNLCFPIALHWLWNWLQGPVLGYEVSGNRFGESLLNLRLSANEWMNGGDFGFEGSLLCTLLLIAGTLIIMKMESGKWRMEN